MLRAVHHVARNHDAIRRHHAAAHLEREVDEAAPPVVDRAAHRIEELVLRHYIHYRGTLYCVALRYIALPRRTRLESVWGTT